MQKTTESAENVPPVEEQLQISLKHTKIERRLSRIKRRLLAKHVWYIRLGILAGFALGFVGLIFIVRFIFASTQLGFYASIVNHFLFTPEHAVNMLNDRTNILVLGKAGEGNSAPDLTDTIMVASISHTGNGIVLLSLPRDIWIPDLRTKLNSAYYWGNKKQAGGGLILASSSVEAIVGMPIHYTAVIDSSGFVEIIDILGGVRVDVERSFVDEKFPIPGRENDECEGDIEFKCRYETLQFEEGSQLMDGETALKFSRSRQSKDIEEGTDLAREARQQKVLSAIKEKITSSEVLFSPSKLNQLWSASLRYLETDMSPQAMAVFARRALQSKDAIFSAVVPEEMLINPPLTSEYDNLYVFTPREGDWTEIHAWVKSLLP